MAVTTKTLRQQLRDTERAIDRHQRMLDAGRNTTADGFSRATLIQGLERQAVIVGRQLWRRGEI